MYIIGLTGAVGSGKSTAAHILAEETGARLLLTDEIGHMVMEPGERCYMQIVEHFGSQILDAEGAIDRRALAAQIFAQEQERIFLDDLIHPAVIAYLQEEIQKSQGQAGFLILESALLFESGCEALCDEIWHVSVSETCRRARLVQDRGYSQEKITVILQRQMQEEEYASRCDVSLQNDGTQEMLRQQIRDLLKKRFGDVF